jgi:hypothetical protein
MCVRSLIALLVSAAVPVNAAAQWDSTTTTLLERGDSGAAVERLRLRTSAGGTPDEWCSLARLLALRATDQDSSWRLRQEAADAFERGLQGREDPLCLLGYALLKEKQGARMDAQRMLRRVGQMTRDTAHSSPAVKLETLYRRALLIDDWLRNFDFLVRMDQLAVSTPACANYGYFCENFTRPREFNERFLAAPALSSVITDTRRAVVDLLDSGLALDPTHADLQRLRLRRALVDGGWAEFAPVARRVARTAPGSVAARLALLASEAQRADYRRAARTLAGIDSLIPDSARVAFERLAVITRDANLTRADALWTLSDPLYLTPANERRIQLYARIALADIMFTDPTAGVAGRDTGAGKLVLRYGWPAHIWEIARDARLQLDPVAMRQALEIVSCGGSESELACAVARGAEARGVSHQAGGRWTFFNYGLDLPSFVFERDLSERSYEYKQQTLTEQLDSSLARVLPSSYDDPYGPGTVSAVITRFPRPSGPVVEVHARFRWHADRVDIRDRVSVGVYVHDRLTARLVGRGVTEREGLGDLRFQSAVPVPEGTYQVAVEGMATAARVARQTRAAIRMDIPVGLGMSDLLLAESAAEAEGAEVRTRDDIRLVARTDTVPPPGTDLVVYWETYGLIADADSSVTYSVAVQFSEAAGGRSPGAELVRVLGRVLGVRREQDRVTWQRERRVGSAGLIADVITIRLPDAVGDYDLVVEVRDEVTGATARSIRRLTLR